jgi:hypothetical protein
MPLRMFSVVLSVLVVFACSYDPSRTELIGSYEAKYDYGVESLTLNADGTYQQIFRYNNGQILKNNGKWEWRSSKSVFDDRLLLEDALVVDNDHGEPEKNVRTYDWFLGAEKDLSGNIKLPFNYDLDFAYHKRRSVEKN